MSPEQKAIVDHIMASARHHNEAPAYQQALDAIIEMTDRLGIYPVEGSDSAYRDIVLNAVSAVASEFNKEGMVSSKKLDSDYALYRDGGKVGVYDIPPRQPQLITPESVAQLLSAERKKEAGDYTITGADHRKYTVKHKELLFALKTELMFAGLDKVYETLKLPFPPLSETIKM